MLKENKLLMEKKAVDLTKLDFLKIINDPQICSGDIRDLVRKLIERLL